MAHPTRFERVTFAFATKGRTPPTAPNQHHQPSVCALSYSWALGQMRPNQPA